MAGNCNQYINSKLIDSAKHLEYALKRKPQNPEVEAGFELCRAQTLAFDDVND
ncbi:hypothetical protein TWF694_009898 [Orbilia ellipsospora]|uniref:Uncharacterized protein n=1 Tax=Orbilia ellipsospora TaxID=2528407 RepID=A0AAV9XC81_9PEZI